MRLWREKLFVILSRNAVSATAFCRLPLIVSWRSESRWISSGCVASRLQNFRCVVEQTACHRTPRFILGDGVPVRKTRRSSDKYLNGDNYELCRARHVWHVQNERHYRA